MVCPSPGSLERARLAAVSLCKFCQVLLWISNRRVPFFVLHGMFGFGRDKDIVNGFPGQRADICSRMDSAGLDSSSFDSDFSPGVIGRFSLPPSAVQGSEDRYRSARGFPRAPYPAGSCSAASVTEQLEQEILAESRGLIRRNVPESSKVWVRAHKWKPHRQPPCLICKEYGHHPSNCLEGLRDRVAVAHDQCVNGYHFPYLHGVWRCQNCGEHLYDADVKRQYPAFHKLQAERELGKIRKYGSPCLSWQ